MAGDKLDVLEALVCELSFLERGGYRRSVRTPWLPKSVFQDSPSCPNHGSPNRAHSCRDCPWIGFVPWERRAEAVPCHHILLNERGDTVETLLWDESQRRLERAVRNWLWKTIDELEKNEVSRSSSAGGRRMEGGQEP